MKTTLVRYDSPVYAITRDEYVWLRSRHGVMRLKASKPVLDLIGEPNGWHGAPEALQLSLTNLGIKPGKLEEDLASGKCATQISVAAAIAKMQEHGLTLPVLDLTRASTYAQALSSRSLVYLHAGHRILLGLLYGGSPCPACIATRFRATYAFRAIADAPWCDILDPPLRHSGASHGSCKKIQRLLETVIAELIRRPPELLLFDMRIKKERVSIRMRPVLPLPGCALCKMFTPQIHAVSSGPVGGHIENSMRRYSSLVDACTGIIGAVQVHALPTGRLFEARTWTRLDTARFNMVRAYVGGAAVRLEREHAVIACMGEAIERYAAGIVDCDQLLEASFADISRYAVDPRCLLYLGPVLSSRIALESFDPNQNMKWTRARDIHDESTRMVPAACAFLPYRASVNERFVRPNSTGLAAGTSMTGARTRALLEVIERYAWLEAWSRRHVRQRLNVRPCCDEMQRIIDHLRGASSFLWAADISVSELTPAVVAGTIDARSGTPLLGIGFRAAFNLHDALAGALCEIVQSQLHLKSLLGSRPIPDTVDELRTLDDLYLFYCKQERLRCLEFLWQSDYRGSVPCHGAAGHHSGRASRPMDTLCRTLDSLGLEAWFVDLTPRDLRSAGVTVVRALLGEAEQRVSPTIDQGGALRPDAVCRANDWPPPL